MATIDIQNKSLSDMASFLGTMEAFISTGGGRRFRVHGDPNPRTSLALKDIIKIVEKKCQADRRPKAPLATVAAIKYLDKQGTHALQQANLFKRILTYICEFFGNLFFNKNTHLKNLTPSELAPEDNQFLVNEFNRHVAPDAAQKLVNHLANLGEAGQIMWTMQRLQSLAALLYRTSPQRMMEIMALPDANTINITPLKADLNILILEAQRLAAAQQPRPLPIVQQPIPVPQRPPQPLPVTQQAPRSISAPAHLVVPRQPPTLPTQHPILIPQQPTLPAPIHPTPPVDDSNPISSPPPDYIDPVARQDSIDAIRNKFYTLINRASTTRNPSLWDDNEVAQELADLFIQYEFDMEASFNAINWNPLIIGKIVYILSEEGYDTTTDKRYNDLISLIQHFDKAIYSEIAEKLMYLFSQNHFEVEQIQTALSPLIWTTKTVAAMINKFKKDPGSIDAIQEYVRNHDISLYTKVLMYRLLLQGDFLNRDLFISNLTDEEHNNIILAISEEVNICTGANVVFDLQRDFEEEPDSSFLMTCIQTLYNRLWNLIELDPTEKASDHGNKSRIAATTQSAIKAMQAVINTDQKMAARIYADVMKDWGDYALELFKRHYPNNEIALEGWLKEMSNLIQPDNMFFKKRKKDGIDVAKDEIDIKRKEFFYTYLCDEYKESYFIYEFIQNHGRNRDIKFRSFIYNLPKEMYGYILSKHHHWAIDECLRRLAADKVTEAEKPDLHKAAKEKFEIIFKEFDEHGFHQYFPGFVVKNKADGTKTLVPKEVHFEPTEQEMSLFERLFSKKIKRKKDALKTQSTE